MIGRNAQPDALGSVCDALRHARPREPVDGILLVIGATEIADLDERGVEAHANRLRTYLTEIERRFHAAVPVYIIVTRYDTLWACAHGSRHPVLRSSGAKLRASANRFFNMGLAQPPAVQAQVRAGMPFYSYMRSVVLPEREIVPLRMRWRDDPVLLVSFGIGVLLLLVAAVLALVL